MKSVISDLVDRIEGYKDVPDYDIESIRRYENAIVIVIRQPQTDTTGNGQTEPGAQNESN